MTSVPIVPFLIIFPMIIAFVMLIIPVNPTANRVRNAIAYLSCIAVMAAVGILTAVWIEGGAQPVSLYHCIPMEWSWLITLLFSGRLS